MFQYKKIVYLQDIKEMNKLLDFVKKNRNIVYRDIMQSEKMGYNAYLCDKMVYFSLCFKEGTKAITYIIRKDGENVIQTLNGGEAYRIMNLYYNVPDTEIPGSARPFLYKNPLYENKRNKDCYEYDINSAYAWALCQPLPDTSVECHSGIVMPGEIGFLHLPYRDKYDTYSFDPVFEGYATHIFPKIIIKPLVKFAEAWYNKKVKAINEIEKAKCKNVITYSIGMLQRHNPFLRSAVVGYCNNRIADLMDDNTIYCNTDSLTSLVPRSDLVIGEELGNFKLSNTGDFAYIGYNYQWNNEKPKYKGIPNSWFPKNWDILKDEIPSCGNVIKFDYETFKLRRIKENEFKS